jgi:cytoskeleton protein RodZ
MTSIGDSLRQERLRRDLGLEQISRELKISSRFLEAIEDERFEKLPGGVFAKSFVRQYARYLGLDDDEYAAAVQQVVEPPSAAQFLSTPSLPPVDIALPRVEEWRSVGERRFNWSSSLPALALVVIAMLVCSGVYALWQRSRRAAQLHEERPAAMATVHASPPAAQPQPAPPPLQAGDTAPAAASPSAAVGPPAPSSVPDASRPAPEPAAPAPAAEAGASNPAAAVKVELTATEPVWVLAKADGKYLFSGTIDASQTRTVEAAGTLTLRIGNAGGLNITLNGKPIGPVGPKGQVRTVQFTSGGFQIEAAPKPSPPLDPL